MSAAVARRVWAVGLGGVLLAACAAQPRQPPAAGGAALAASAVAAAPSAAAVKQLAQRIDARGAHGRMSTAQREVLVQQLSAQGAPTLVQRQLAATAAVGEADVLAGNRVQLLIDGPQTFDSLFQAIESARQSVLVESYIVDDAQIARRLSEALRRKRAQGVQVAMVYDAIGSFGTDKAYFDELRSAGVLLCAFNPPASARPRESQPVTERDHRKIVAVDRQVAFAGGINISAVYSSGSGGRRFGGSGAGRRASNAEDGKDAGWRDTHVRVQGPAALKLDALVRETWSAQGCQGELGAPARPAAPATAPGREAVLVVPAEPDDGHSRVYTLLMAAFDTAQRSIQVTMAYFAPGREMIDALCDAARRGVDVQLVLPSRSDFTPVMLAGQSHYQELLDAGVRLYEFQGAVLHAKTVVVDGVWSTVGSSNLDYRSFTGNNEVNLVVLGEDFGSLMGRQFAADVAASRAITAESWSRRPLFQRMKELGARLLERLW